jgi:hypothetical protein
LAGVVVGRLTRGIKDRASADSDRQRPETLGTRTGTPIAGVTTEEYAARPPWTPTGEPLVTEPLVTEDPRRIPGV